MTTAAESPTDRLPTEPDTCGQQLRTDPSKVCQAHRIDGSDRCLVHHPNRRDIIESILVRDDPILDFSNSEVDQDLLDDLVELNAVGRSVSPLHSVAINFSDSNITAGFRDLTFPGIVDFRSARFSEPVRFYTIQFLADVTFNGAAFLDYTTFSHIEFSGKAIFSGTTFSGSISFHATQFTTEANFGGAVFSEPVSFFNTQFQGNADFTNVQFSGTVDFTKTQFSTGLYLSSATFAGQTKFSSVTLADYAELMRVAFESKVEFYNTTFPTLINFEQVAFLDEVSLMDVTFESMVSFKGVTFCNSVQFTNVKFCESTNFTNTQFLSNVAFFQIEFNEFADFTRVKCSAGIEFRHVQFFRSVTFEDTTCSGAVVFSYATFSHEAYFGGMECLDAVEFSETKFSHDADFEGMKCSDTVLFLGVIFSGDVNFLNAELPPLMDLIDVTFSTLANFGSTTGEGEIELIRCAASASCLIILGSVPMALDRFSTTYPLTIDGYMEDDTSALAVASVSILGSTFISPVTITANIKLTASSFRESTGLDHLRFQGDPEWQIYRGRTVIVDEIDEASDITPRELEVLYRQLRAGLEASKAAPAAADFFYGEMEARRTHTRRQSNSARLERLWSIRYTSLRWWLLSSYKWFAGYGVRAWRAFASYFASVVVIGLSFFWFDEQLVGSGEQAAQQVESFWRAMAFSLRNSIYLFSAPDIDLQPWGIMVLALGRLAGVAFLALAVIGLRSHTER